jgi:non-heme Fe2+,alpha-ketoglutarate-dependent halogenase
MGKHLTSEDVAKYREDGVLFPISVFAAEEVQAFQAALAELERHFDGRAKPHEAGQCHLHFAWAARLVKDPRILDIVEDIIGPDILVHSSTIFKKFPREGSFVSWHQDGYYLDLDQPDFVSAWVALTESGPANGCLRVVRGSHRKGRMAHTNSAAAPRNLLTSGLEIQVRVEESEATDVVLRPGEMSLHDVNIVHGSNPNHSGISRVGFAIRYVAPHVIQASRHHQVMLARGADRYGRFEEYANAPAEDFELAAAAHRRFSGDLQAKRRRSGRLG